MFLSNCAEVSAGLLDCRRKGTPGGEEVAGSESAKTAKTAKTELCKHTGESWGYRLE